MLIDFISNAVALGVLGFSIKTFKGKPNQRQLAKAASTVWEPKIVPSEKFTTREGYSPYGGRTNIPISKVINGEMAVRLVRKEDMIPIGTARVLDSDFTEKMNALVETAEEKAAALNAVEQMYA